MDTNTQCDWKKNCLRCILCLFFVLASIYTYKDVKFVLPLPLTIPKTTISPLTTTRTVNFTTLEELFVYGLPLNSIPREAFVTFCNNQPRYLALLTTVLDAVHEFSTRPIIVFGIDVDLNISVSKYPRVIKRRLSQKTCGPSIFFCKIAAIVHSQIDYGIYIEADTIVNYNVDILFDLLHKWPYQYPLAPRHPDDPRNYGPFLKRFNLDFTKRTTPYIHAHILWNYRSYPFLQQVLYLMRKGQFMGANYDETAVNVLRWKAKANHTLCMIDPYYGFLPVYDSNNKTICHKYCHFTFIYIHGSKNAQHNAYIFQRLKNRTGSPFILTPRDGLHYLNETNYTCCYPDSKRSSIHPLLCEH